MRSTAAISAHVLICSEPLPSAPPARPWLCRPAARRRAMLAGAGQTLAQARQGHTRRSSPLGRSATTMPIDAPPAGNQAGPLSCSAWLVSRVSDGGADSRQALPGDYLAGGRLRQQLDRQHGLAARTAGQRPVGAGFPRRRELSRCTRRCGAATETPGTTRAFTARWTT